MCKSGPVVLSLALFAAACGSDQAAEDANSYEVDAERGVTTSQITTEDGTARMETGTGVAAKLPEGFTVFPGATMVSASNITTEQGTGTMAIMEIGKPAEEVVAFYRRQAEAVGVAIQLDMNGNGTRMIGGEGKGGLAFSLTATEADGKTSAQLMIGTDKPAVGKTN